MIRFLFFMIYLLILFPVGLKAQVEYLIDTDNSFYLDNVRIDNNGDYISLFSEDSSDYHYTAGIIKFDEGFNYQMYTHDIDTADVLLRDFVVTGENNYLIAGTIGKDNGQWYSNHIIYILLLDEDFNFLSENFYYLPEEYNNPYIKMFKNDDGRIYVIVDALTDFLKGVIEISETGQIIKEQMYYDMGGGIMNPFPSPQSGFYLLRGSEVGWAVGEITWVDTSLNFTTTVLPAYINGQWYFMGSRGSCKWLNDTTYILISEGASETYGNDLYIYKMSSDHEFLAEPFIIGRENEDDQSLWYRGIDWIDAEHIYVAGWSWASMSTANEYYVAIINENFEVLGAKSYGGDNNNFINSLLATEDGGCVIVGGQRDYQAGDEYDWNGYVAFFSPDDIITTAAETPNPYDSDYLLFPNPGNDQLIIQTAKQGVCLKMYAQNGKLILDKVLSDDFRNTIGTDKLPCGFYFCRLTDKQGNTEYKKWIKQ